MNLSSLWIYPLKAVRGLALDEAVAETRGLAGDRRWMLVDEAGRFLSQRSHPRLALVTTQFTEDGLLVAADGLAALPVPRPDAAPSLDVTVWGDTVPAIPVSDEADAWFSRYLGVPCRLVYMPEQARRPVDPAYASGDHHVSFADGFPILLIGTASLADLNARLDTPVTMQRFRPNLVVETDQPFVEDTWRRIQLGEVVLDLVKPCARCTVTTIDPDRGEKGKEPLRTLATYRRQGSKVLFGQNVLVHRSGRLQVGAAVTVLDAG